MDALLLGCEGTHLLGRAPCDLAADADAAAQVSGLVARLMHVDARGTDDDGGGAAWLEVVFTSCYSQVAAAAAGTLGAGGCSGAGGGDGAAGEQDGGAAGTQTGAALPGARSCVYLMHDTHLVGTQLVPV